MTSWTVACQTPLSMEFSRQEYCRLPFPTSGDLANLGIEPASLMSPALASRFFTTAPRGNVILLSHITEQNLSICDNIDGPRGYYAMLNKSDIEKCI